MFSVRVSIAALAVSLLSNVTHAQTSEVPAEPSATMLGGVAAIVNDEVISISDVAQRARLLLITLGVDVSQESMQQAMPRALDELIDERLQLQKATEFELEVGEEEITEQVRDIAAQNQSTVEQLYESLRVSGVNPQTLQDQMRAEIAWQRIMSGLYGSRIRISSLQIDGMLDRMAASASEEQYRLAEIFLYAPTDADKQQILAGANVILEQLRQGARFQLAAQQYSNSPTAAVGGDLGWVAPSELQPEVQAVLAQTEAPALTNPIIVDDGVYIYALRGKQAASDSTSQEVDLRQVISADGNTEALSALAERQPACDALEAETEESGLIYAALGRVPESALTGDVRAAVSSVPVGGASDVIETPAGAALLFVCDRSLANLELPSRDQIENRLYNQQIAMLSQRDLRDLKREATIIRR